MSNFLSRMTPFAWILLLMAFLSMISIVVRLATWRSHPRSAPTPTYRRGCLAGLLVGMMIGIWIGGAIVFFISTKTMFR